MLLSAETRLQSLSSERVNDRIQWRNNDKTRGIRKLIEQ